MGRGLHGEIVPIVRSAKEEGLGELGLGALGQLAVALLLLAGPCCPVPMM